jgi:hypothetical protein
MKGRKEGRQEIKEGSEGKKEGRNSKTNSYQKRMRKR